MSHSRYQNFSLKLHIYRGLYRSTYTTRATRCTCTRCTYRSSRMPTANSTVLSIEKRPTFYMKRAVESCQIHVIFPSKYICNFLDTYPVKVHIYLHVCIYTNASIYACMYRYGCVSQKISRAGKQVTHTHTHTPSTFMTQPPRFPPSLPPPPTRTRAQRKIRSSRSGPLFSWRKYLYYCGSLFWGSNFSLHLSSSPLSRLFGCSRYVSQKSPKHSLKEPFISVPFIWHPHIKQPSLGRVRLQLVCLSQEPYVSSKRTLYICQKSPVCLSKEPDISIKRTLFMSKEPFISSSFGFHVSCIKHPSLSLINFPKEPYISLKEPYMSIKRALFVS